MISPYLLPAATFEDLARGRGGPDSIAFLRSARLSKHLLLIRALLDAVRASADRELKELFLTAFDVLCEAQQRAGPETAELLAHPNIGTWAAHCVRGIRTSAGLQASRLDLAHLGGVAFVAAGRAGLDCTLMVPVRDGEVVLPAWGRFILPSADRQAVAIVKRADGVWLDGHPIALTPTAQPRDRGVVWEPIRHLVASCRGIDVDVGLDDIDPYRDVHGRRPMPRLAPADVAVWADLMDRGWALLVGCDAERAREVAAGVRSMVPLVTTDPAHGISSTSQDGFGAFALTLPDSALTLAIAFVHEFQHSKLSALLDLVPLYDESAPDRYYAPWRDDPRPLGGLLQGAYAFLGITDFWRRMLRSSPAVDVAEVHLARTSVQVAEVLETLAASGHLTDAGAAFVAIMRKTLDDLTAEPVSEAATIEATRAERHHRLTWHMRNTKPDPDLVRQLTDRWLADPVHPPDRTTTRLAVRRARIAAAPTRLEEWASLLLDLCVAPAAMPQRPELLYPLYATVRRRLGRPPEPVELARWFLANA